VFWRLWIWRRESYGVSETEAFKMGLNNQLSRLSVARLLGQEVNARLEKHDNIRAA